MNIETTFEKFKNINKKKYLGQCDTLRRLSDDNESKWYDMMKNKKKISFNMFEKNVDTSIFTDEDYTFKDYIKETYMSDPDTQTYISTWGDKECMFLQTAGFEFIFI